MRFGEAVGVVLRLLQPMCEAMKIHVLVLYLGITDQMYDLGGPASIQLMVLATRIMFLDSQLVQFLLACFQGFEEPYKNTQRKGYVILCIYGKSVYNWCAYEQSTKLDDALKPE